MATISGKLKKIEYVEYRGKHSWRATLVNEEQGMTYIGNLPKNLTDSMYNAHYDNPKHNSRYDGIAYWCLFYEGHNLTLEGNLKEGNLVGFQFFTHARWDEEKNPVKSPKESLH